MGTKGQSENADQSGNILKSTLGHVLAVARSINKQDDYTKFMLSIIAIVTWLLSKVSTYSKLGQIRNWEKTVHVNKTLK